MTDPFDSLPERAPYGFSISPDGNFSIVSDWGAHSEASKKLGFKNTDVLMHEGGVRMYHGNLKTGTFAASYIPRKVTRKALKVATDLAEWYRRELEYDNDPYLKETTMRKKSRNATFRLKEFFPELISKNAVNEVALGLGGGYGGAAGGPVAGSWGATPNSPGFADARSGMFKSQNYPNPATGSNGAVTMAQLMQGQKYPDQEFGKMIGSKYQPATKPVDSGGNNIPPTQHIDQGKTNQHGNSYMQGNTVISNGLVDVISPEDLSDSRFNPDELRQGIRQEMKSMEYPLKTVALAKAKENLSKNPKYYSNLGIYDMGIE